MLSDRTETPVSRMSVTRRGGEVAAKSILHLLADRGAAMAKV